MFQCPQCDAPLTKPECGCGFLYRPPHQPELQMRLQQRKPGEPDDLRHGPINYRNI